ncbi:MAG: hypothetical protein LBC43_00725 [Bifidobacteriaceae bacterium]|nr:hypothetical protein [Bifidobacteriaceae bacterium]
MNRWLLFLFSMGILSIALSPLSDDSHLMWLLLGLLIALSTGIPLGFELKRKYFPRSKKGTK